jgi:hypothetical protein
MAVTAGKSGFTGIPSNASPLAPRDTFGPGDGAVNPPAHPEGSAVPGTGATSRGGPREPLTPWGGTGIPGTAGRRTLFPDGGPELVDPPLHGEGRSAWENLAKLLSRLVAPPDSAADQSGQLGLPAPPGVPGGGAAEGGSAPEDAALPDGPVAPLDTRLTRDPNLEGPPSSAGMIDLGVLLAGGGPGQGKKIWVLKYMCVPRTREVTPPQTATILVIGQAVPPSSVICACNGNAVPAPGGGLQLVETAAEFGSGGMAFTAHVSPLPGRPRPRVPTGLPPVAAGGSFLTPAAYRQSGGAQLLTATGGGLPSLGGLSGAGTPMSSAAAGDAEPAARCPSSVSTDTSPRARRGWIPASRSWWPAGAVRWRPRSARRRFPAPLPEAAARHPSIRANHPRRRSRVSDPSPDRSRESPTSRSSFWGPWPEGNGRP